MACVESSRLHAFVDNELDAAQHAKLQQHIAGCAECSAQLDELTSMRSLMKRSSPSIIAPAHLRSRIERALDAEGIAPTKTESQSIRKTWQLPSFWLGAVSGMGLATASTVLAFLLITTRLSGSLVDEMVAAHVQSLHPGQLIAVVSADRHTVKPWFAGRADVSPAVADFAAQGYRLIGGRVDAIAQQRAAVSVYEHGAHVINVFTWVARPADVVRDTTRNGYHVACWQTGNLNYCAMSDTGWAELRGLQHLLQSLGEQQQIDHGS
jgi:anti-sigma factor (TIGR02949 family)